MPKKTRGEQMALLDVGPENEKEIVKVALAYKEAQSLRISALNEEVAKKQELLELIRKADLKVVKGKIKFHVDGLLITVTPRDELVRVKEEKAPEPAAD